ncbi:AMP-binding protein [Ramlibacter tataouinensis]|uniref:class I adenylate-forming enzyme family protein n=1 Tax=Ramlibacter tataouinensis TaxID=94132 RepID=UPI0022F3824A|nr:AMP-binding protein [Ramlibacter tataouinensis]WBY01356.1 AMP-binding protein [Ramlibacter tataouinensis]
MNLAHALARIARQDPRRPAVFVGDRLHRDYGALADHVARLAAGLLEQGLVPGDRVALFMHNHPAYLELLYACWWAGLAVVPMNAKLHLREAQWIADHAGVRWAFVTADVGAGLQAERCIDVDGAGYAALPAPVGLPLASCAPTDLAWLFYTSGTTGKPKGVMLTHRNLQCMAMGYFCDVDPIEPEDAIVYGPPMSHGAGLYALPHMVAGARHVVPASGGFEPEEIFELARRIGRLTMFAAPTVVKRLVDHAEAHGLSGEGFKTIVYGGAPMYVQDLQRALRVLGPRFVQIYGQGESPMVITALSRRHLLNTTHPRHAARVASVGVAQTPVEVRVADPEGGPLPAGEVGEVLVRGDTVMAGYWRDPQATEAAIRDGWLFTGDMGSLDEDGFLTLRDRSKDMIISGGSNIYPREVEEVLLTAPGVAEASVVGAPDPEWGEIVVAFVVPQPGTPLDEAALDAVCLQHIARFKRPKRYVFTDALPKNNYGKVLKTELRRQLKEESA